MGEMGLEREKMIPMRMPIYTTCRRPALVFTCGKLLSPFCVFCRANMEEELSGAFGGVIRELQARVAGLTAERDRLLGTIEELKGGWSRGFESGR